MRPVTAANLPSRDEATLSLAVVTVRLAPGEVWPGALAVLIVPATNVEERQSKTDLHLDLWNIRLGAGCCRVVLQ